MALTEFFGVAVYLTFVGHDHHVVLFEIGVRYMRDEKLVDHPLTDNATWKITRKTHLGFDLSNY